MYPPDVTYLCTRYCTLSMPYKIVPHPKKEGRFRVISEKGRVWKTDYATKEAAEKGVAYIENRSAGDSGTPSSSASQESPDTSAERKELGIPEVETEEGW